MRKPILLIVVAMSAWANGNLCLSTSTSNSGTWSSAATWTNCGGTVPGDGDWVVWRSSGTLTVDVNVGTPTEGIQWIRQENGTISINPGITVTFHSTGTNPTGSGTATNPGADATMQGFFLARGTAFQINGTATGRVTITAANGTSPVYIHHWNGDFTGCTAFTANVCNGTGSFPAYPNESLSYVDIYNLGTAAAEYYGNSLGGASNQSALAVSADHCRYYSPYKIFSEFPTPGMSFRFTFNTIYNPTFKWLIDTTAMGSYSWNASGWQITDNTLIVGNSPPAASSSGYAGLAFFIGGASHLSLQRNAVYNTVWSSTNPGMASEIYNAAGPAGSGNNIIRNNFDYFVEPASSSGTMVPCSGFMPQTADPTSVFDRNVCTGYTSSIGNGTNSSGFQVSVTNNWNSQWKEGYNGQGCWITHGSGGTGNNAFYTFHNNVCLAENSAAGLYPMGILAYGNVLNTVTAYVDHNTFLAPNGGGEGIQVGEAHPYSTINSSIRSNMVWGWAQYQGAQIMGGNNPSGGSTFLTACPSGSWGVCDNLTYGAGSQGQYYKSASTTNFDNGATAHPSPIYGDLTVNPRLVDTTRRPCGFGVVLGLGGTCTTLFAALASRALGTNGCTVCGAYTDGGYGASGDNVIEAMRKWLFWGATPTNPVTWCAGHDGESVGAVAFCAHGKAMLGAAAF